MTRITSFIAFFYCCLALNMSHAQQKKIVSQAGRQFKTAFEEIKLAKNRSNDKTLVSPRSLRADTISLVSPKDWTSGFFAGNLWYMYELSGDKYWIEKAREFTEPLEMQKNNGTTHDMGFKLFCSYGNGLRITGDPKYKEILLTAAKTLSTRFNPKVGCLRSWDHNADKWQFPVIIDNMLNLELLFWATKQTGDSSYYKIAISHADKTMQNHYRPDNSSYHVIGYNPETGQVEKRNTHQGYSDASSWARGQAWGLYGFTMCFRETKNKAYLNHAEKIAAYILNHPSMPRDLVPYWDYNDPKIPDAPRDASAAAVTASALYELSTMNLPKSAFYLETANKIMKSLSSEYTCKPGTNKGFLLTSSTGHLPSNLEVNVPIVYADYYYLEALKRAKNLKK